VRDLVGRLIGGLITAVLMVLGFSITVWIVKEVLRHVV
jgi:hypothetical protein